MRHAALIAAAIGFAAAPALAGEPILLRDMGSFHIGGRLIEITGQPVKEIVFTPGGGSGTWLAAVATPPGRLPARVAGDDCHPAHAALPAVLYSAKPGPAGVPQCARIFSGADDSSQSSRPGPAYGISD